jgi:hypothetical protein
MLPRDPAPSAFVFVLLALDLGVFNREAHVVSVREALGWSAVWIALGLSFSIFVYFGYRSSGWASNTRPGGRAGSLKEGQRWQERRIKFLTGTWSVVARWTTSSSWPIFHPAFGHNIVACSGNHGAWSCAKS